MFSRRNDAEKRYDALEAQAGKTLGRLLDKDISKLSDADKEELATAGIFAGNFGTRCLSKAFEVYNARISSTRLKDRFLRHVGYTMPGRHDPAIVRAVKEDIVREYDAYQAKLEVLRQQGASAARIAEEAQRFAQELKEAATLKEDLIVGKPLKLKQKPNRKA